MDFSLGLIEIQALGHAILVLDTMTKAADVEFVAVERKLGGRLVTLVIRGKLSAVKAAIDALDGKYGVYNKDNGVVFWFEIYK